MVRRHECVSIINIRWGEQTGEAAVCVTDDVTAGSERGVGEMEADGGCLVREVIIIV